MTRLSHHYGKLAAIVLAMAAGASTAHAQETVQHTLTPADQAVVQRYTLTEDSYQKLLATAKDAKANKVKIDMLDPNAHTLDDRAADLNKNPDVSALLARHDLTPREFLLGEYALLGAEYAVKYGNTPGVDKHLANPANVALFRKHEAEIDALSGDDSNN
jgi:cytochrome c551/c552